MKTLIFETEAGGHRPLYFNILIGHAAANADVGEVVFAMSSDLWQRLEQVTRACVERFPQRLRVRLLTAPELAAANRTGAELLRNLARWRLAMRIAREEQVSRVHFPLLDDVIKAAALMPSTPFSISGIYFRPTAHFPEYWRGVGGYARQFAKSALLRRYMRRRDASSILSFDPYFTESAAGQTSCRAVTLPEPFDAVHSKEAGAPTPGRRIGFLLFGALQWRKGIEEFLAALHLLSEEVRAGAEFTVCGVGPLAPLIERQVPELVAKGVQIGYVNRFLSERELEEKLSSADVIVAPYRNHIGSSGVLYLAAARAKPVITQGTGLVGRQVAEHGLGRAVDTADPAAIAGAIADLVGSGNGGCSPEGCARFVSGHGREPFARTIYANLG